MVSQQSCTPAVWQGLRNLQRPVQAIAKRHAQDKEARILMEGDHENRNS